MEAREVMTRDVVTVGPDATVGEIAAILVRNRISAVPVVWYIGHVPPDGSAEWDTVPIPQAGNTLTPREYQSRWLDKYGDLAATNSASTTAASSTVATPAGCPGGLSITPLDDGWAYPTPADLFANGFEGAASVATARAWRNPDAGMLALPGPRVPLGANASPLHQCSE